MEQDLVQYPFKIFKKEQALLFRVQDGYEMRFTEEIGSKKVQSTVKQDTKRYLTLEIFDDGSVKIEEFNKLFVFDEPADFYVPASNDSKSFYNSIHESLVGNDLDKLFEKAIDLDKYLQQYKFPEYPLPVLTSSTHFENFENATAVRSKMPRIPVQQCKPDEPVPNTFNPESKKILSQYLTDEQMNAQEIFYKSYFAHTPISRFRSIITAYEESDTEFKRTISLNLLKRCICLHGYFMSAGPWRKCWIRFGLDPRIDREMYKYQIVEYRTKKANFQIFEKPEITAEVEKNKSWYLIENYDPNDGFISTALKNFIIYIIDNGENRLIEKRIDDLNDSDFEIFDF